MRLLTLILLLVFSCGLLEAQTERLCSSDEYNQNRFSSLQKNKNSQTTNYTNVNLNTNILSNTKICLPVVVHNVYKKQDQKISTEAIVRQIEQLNKDFNANSGEFVEVHPYFENLVANVGIEFYLMDNGATEENSNNGINYYKTLVDTFYMNAYPNIKSSIDGGLSSFNTKNYINIWVGNLEAGVKGYASLPNGKGSINDGIVVHYSNFGNNNKTLSHEMGHFFGLNHLFGIEEGLCDEDDNVKDTPQTATAYKTCTTDNLISNQCNDQYFEYDLTQNFMNLCNDECLKMFTKGQKVNMLYNLLTNRKSLLINNCNDDTSKNELDISIVNLNTTPIICGNELILNYEICNTGKVEISGFNFNLNEFIVNEFVELTIYPNQCIAYNQAVDLTFIRVNTFIAQIGNVNNNNEELNLKNNVAKFDFRSVSLLNLPFEEDFSKGNSWFIANQTAEYNWMYLSNDENTIKNDCYAFKPHPLNQLSIGNLYSPVFKLAEGSFEDENANDDYKIYTISFDAAYASSSENIVLDYLFVEYIDVCTDSTYQLIGKVDLDEATTNLTWDQLLLQPDNNGWKNYSFDLDTENLVSSLNLKLTYVSTNNNILLIDNFKIEEKYQAPLNIQSYINQNKAGFYPNPATVGIVHFYAERYKGQFAMVSLYNQLGKLQQNFQLNNYQQLNFSHLPNGHYYVIFKWDNKIVTQKLLLLK